MWNRGRSGNRQRYVCVRCGGTLTPVATTAGWRVPERTPCLVFRKGEGWSDWRHVTTTTETRFETHGMAGGMMLFDCGGGWLLKVRPELVRRTRK